MFPWSSIPSASVRLPARSTVCAPRTKRRDGCSAGRRSSRAAMGCAAGWRRPSSGSGSRATSRATGLRSTTSDMRKICVVTGSRADYGLLHWVMHAIRDSKSLELQVVASGMHLSPEFGMTVRGIEADGFAVAARVDMQLTSDSGPGIGKSIGLGVIGFADAFAALAPDMLVVLGDRFETLAAVAAALPARLPVAHVAGGDVTEGSFDDATRHAITKMS